MGALLKSRRNASFFAVFQNEAKIRKRNRSVLTRFCGFEQEQLWTRDARQVKA